MGKRKPGRQEQGILEQDIEKHSGTGAQQTGTTATMSKETAAGEGKGLAIRLAVRGWEGT